MPWKVNSDVRKATEVEQKASDFSSHFTTRKLQTKILNMRFLRFKFFGALI